MNFDTAWKVSFWIHIIIAQGGFLFLSFYKFKNLKDSLIRIIILLFLWILSNIIFNGCPLTHLENFIFLKIYGREIIPNYNFSQSWVHQLISVII